MASSLYLASVEKYHSRLLFGFEKVSCILLMANTAWSIANYFCAFNKNGWTNVPKWQTQQCFCSSAKQTHICLFSEVQSHICIFHGHTGSRNWLVVLRINLPTSTFINISKRAVTTKMNLKTIIFHYWIDLVYTGEVTLYNRCKRDFLRNVRTQDTYKFIRKCRKLAIFR